MSSSGLKLRSMASSMYSKPYKWVRSATTISVTTTTNPNITTTTRTRSPSSPIYTPRCRISHFSSLSSSPARDNKPLSSSAASASAAAQTTNLGFRGRSNRCFAFSGSSSSSSGSVDDKEAEASGSGMGSEHKEIGNNILNRQNSLTSMQNQQQQSSKLLTLPTILTLGRVAAVPVLIGTFYVDSWWGTTATTSIFVAAAITDWLDGYIARKMRLGSAFGAFLDPVADKLMVAATLVLLCTKPLEVDMFGQAPWLLTVPSIAIIGREITMSAVREWAASQNGKLSEAVAVNNLGKWKTATQMTALTILLATRGSSLGGSGLIVTSGVALLYISAALAVWSLVVYMRKIWKVLLK